MSSERPNIVFIMTDEQRFDTIAGLGYTHMDTPNLDRLVREGVVFTNCFVTAPTCAPSRASVFTGYYPHTTGIYRNADPWRKSWVSDLAEAGYHCVNIGKMHTYPWETPLGFHERFVVENKDRYLEGRYFLDRWDMALQAQGLVKQQRELYRQRSDYEDRLGAFEWELPENTHSDVFVGELAQWWLSHKPRQEPLFLQVGFPGPHPPFDPIPRYAEPYLQKDLPLPSVTPEELAQRTRVLQAIDDHNCVVDHDSVSWKPNPSRDELHRMRAYYYANVTMIDEQVGRLMDTLASAGYLDNTILVFTSDHGDCLGDHGQIEKWNMFDCVTRVPMIVWAPQRFAGGRRHSGLCQNFDIGPTILELAGLPVPDAMEAESLLPVLDGNTEEGRAYVFAEQGEDANLKGIVRQITMVRSHDWKLVHYLGDDEGELYDLVSDPGETQNLWQNHAHAAKKHELLGELLRWSLSSGLQTASWKEPYR